MILVIGAMLALSIIVVAGLNAATQQIPQSRHEQDFQAAKAAVQAGVDDYLHHLNVCDNYYQGTGSVCYNALPANPALQASLQTPNWGSAPYVPGTSGNSPEQYLYSVTSTPSQGQGTVQIEVLGHVHKVTRKAFIDFSKPTLLKYIYYTDIEASDPQTVPAQNPAFTMPSCYIGTTNYTNCVSTGVTPANAQSACGYHYYQGPSAPDPGGNTTQGQRSNYSYGITAIAPNGSQVSGTLAGSCDIQFAGGDSINGPLHSNDALLIGNGPTFTNPDTESSWGTGTYTSPAPANAENPYRAVSAGNAPSGNLPVPAPPIGLPPNNASIKQQVISPASGCLYTGPTVIKLLSTGNMTVTSPFTKQTNPGCSSGSFASTPTQTVALPTDGVVYVQNIPASSSDPNYSNPVCVAPWTGPGGYPQAADVVLKENETTCTNGDVYISGILKGQLTVAADHDINVVGDIKYNYVNNGQASGSDVLGLIANNYVFAYHPVSCPLYPADALAINNSTPAFADCTNLTPVGASGPYNSLTIDAAILSVRHSFTVENYYMGADLSDGSAANKLHIFGAIAQEFRGAVGTSGNGGTGYLKDYSYDARLGKQPPPYFLQPASAPWQVQYFQEQ